MRSMGNRLYRRFSRTALLAPVLGLCACPRAGQIAKNPGHVSSPEEGTKICVGIVQSAGDGPDLCGREKCEAQYPEGKRVPYYCTDGTCPITSGKKFAAQCKLEGPPGHPDEYVGSGCYVTYSKVEPCH
jgi:hypothetical protein